MVIFTFLSNPICFNEDKIQVLCLENQKLFREMFGAFVSGETEENNIVFSEDFIPFKFKGNVCVIDDFFRLSYSSAIIKKLYEQVEIYCNNELSPETHNLKTHLVNYMETVIKSYDYDFEFNYDITLSEIFKAINLVPVTDKNEMLNSLVDYILIVNKYVSPKCFVIFNLHLYFTKSEIDLFYKDILDRHVALLVIENTQYFQKSKFENLIIFDTDFCEIVEF